jgi:hypothetical protein
MYSHVVHYDWTLFILQSLVWLALAVVQEDFANIPPSYSVNAFDLDVALLDAVISVEPDDDLWCLSPVPVYRKTTSQPNDPRRVQPSRVCGQ